MDIFLLLYGGVLTRTYDGFWFILEILLKNDFDVFDCSKLRIYELNSISMHATSAPWALFSSYNLFRTNEFVISSTFNLNLCIRSLWGSNEFPLNIDKCKNLIVSLNRSGKYQPNIFLFPWRRLLKCISCAQLAIYMYFVGQKRVFIVCLFLVCVFCVCGWVLVLIVSLPSSSSESIALEEPRFQRKLRNGLFDLVREPRPIRSEPPLLKGKVADNGDDRRWSKSMLIAVRSDAWYNRTEVKHVIACRQTDNKRMQDCFGCCLHLWFRFFLFLDSLMWFCI